MGEWGIKVNPADYIRVVKNAFEKVADPMVAAGQETYMRDQFRFYGVKSPQRKKIQSLFFHKTWLPEQSYYRTSVRLFWDEEMRELHYFGQELYLRCLKHPTHEDLELLEDLITTHSWWDTVDFLAANIAGRILMQHPEWRKETIAAWMASDNLWLQRTCLLFQLKYKADLDEALLEELIAELHPHPDFFIRKAIGWILRSHARVNPEYVRRICHTYPLSPLSTREALKHL